MYQRRKENKQIPSLAEVKRYHHPALANLVRERLQVAPGESCGGFVGNISIPTLPMNEMIGGTGISSNLALSTTEIIETICHTR